MLLHLPLPVGSPPQLLVQGSVTCPLQMELEVKEITILCDINPRRKA